MVLLGTLGNLVDPCGTLGEVLRPLGHESGKRHEIPEILGYFPPHPKPFWDDVGSQNVFIEFFIWDDPRPQKTSFYWIPSFDISVWSKNKNRELVASILDDENLKIYEKRKQYVFS